MIGRKKSVKQLRNNLRDLSSPHLEEIAAEIVEIFKERNWK